MLVQPPSAITVIFAGSVSDIVYSADSSRLFVTTGTSVIALDIATGATLATYALGHAAGALDVSADGQFLAVTSDDDAARFDRITLANGAIGAITLPTAGGFTVPLADLAWLADGSLLLSQAGRKPLLRYDFTSETAVAVSTGRDSATLITSDDRSVVYSLSQFFTWQTDIFTSGIGLTATDVGIPDPYAGPSLPLPLLPVGAVSADGAVVLQGADLKLRDADLQLTATLDPVLGTMPAGAAFSRNGEHLYLAYANGTVLDFDPALNKIIAVYAIGMALVDPASARGNVLQISDNGRYLVLETTGGVLRVDLTKALPTATMGDDIITADGGPVFGLDGDDTMTSTGFGRMAGGKGNDVYITDISDQPIIENRREGIDELRTGYGFVELAANVENLTYTGTADAYLIGNAQANVIIAGPGDDTVIGGLGVDTINGGAGFDTINYERATGGVFVNLEQGFVDPGPDGADKLRGFEAIIGTFYNDFLIGNAAANVIRGGEGADLLAGMGGKDQLFGGMGYDVYLVDNVGDVVSEQDGDGIDRVDSSVSWTLGRDIEDLTLLTNPNLTGTGNDGQNRLTGTDFADTLDGLGGGDFVFGQGGDDVLIGTGEGNFDNDMLDGGAGRDLVSYAGAASGVTVTLTALGSQETGGGGNDTLVDIEDLFGSAFADTLTGSAGDNRLVGRRGHDVLKGGGGNDRLIGGQGIDTVSFADATQGIMADLASEAPQATGTGTVTFSSIENLEGSAFADQLAGTARGNLLSGGAGRDVLIGRGGDDTLKGGLGPDQLYGGSGDDTYLVDDARDAVFETAPDDASSKSDQGGVDLVIASASFSLAAPGARFIENLTLSAGGNRNATGNALANTLIGNNASNRLAGGLGKDLLIGARGADTLDGGEGGDTLFGGAGDDVYIVDSRGDRVIDTAGPGNAADAGGMDTVQSNVSFSLAKPGALEFIENLTLTGAGATNAGGNARANTLIGNAAANGLTGNAGRDLLTGGGGADSFRFNAGDSGSSQADADVITDFTSGEDKIDLAAIDADTTTAGTDQRFVFIGSEAFQKVAGQLRTVQRGGDTLIEGDTDGDGAADVIVVLTGLHTPTSADFVL